MLKGLEKALFILDNDRFKINVIQLGNGYAKLDPLYYNLRSILDHLMQNPLEDFDDVISNALQPEEKMFPKVSEFTADMMSDFGSKLSTPVINIFREVCEEDFDFGRAKDK